MRKKISIILAFVIAIFSFVPLTTNVAYAGAVGSNGSAGGGGGGGTPAGSKFRTPLKWVVKRDLLNNTQIRDTHHRQIEAFNVAQGDAIAYITLKTYIMNYQPVEYPNNWYRWSWWIKEGNGDPGEVAAKYWWIGDMLPNDFRDEATGSGFWSITDGLLYKNSSEYMDLVWIEGAVYEKQDSNCVNTIVRFDSPNGGESFDRSGWDLGYQFDNPVTSVSYGYESAEKEYQYNKQYTATTMQICKQRTWKENSKGERFDERTEYYSGVKYSKTVHANWQTKTPEVTYKPVMPLDLRTEKTMRPEEVGKYYRISDFKDTNLSIQADLRNGKNEGRHDETSIPALDTNTVRDFDVNFKNDQFGIPRQSEGGYDITAEKPPYSDNILDKQIYWEPKLRMSSSVDNYNPYRTSIEIEGQEYKGSDVLTKDYGWKGGQFLFRSIKSGDYKLGYKDKPFWAADLQTGMYFKYGSRHGGQVKASSSGPVFTGVNGNSVNIYDHKRWLDFVQASGKQPVLYGDFNVKTVGGYKK